MTKSQPNEHEKYKQMSNNGEKDLLLITENLLKKQSDLAIESDEISFYIKQQQEKLTNLIEQRDDTQRKSDLIIPILKQQVKDEEEKLEQLTTLSKIKEERFVKQKDRLKELMEIEQQKIEEYNKLTEIMMKQIDELKFANRQQNNSILKFSSDIVGLVDELRQRKYISDSISKINNDLLKRDDDSENS